MHDAKETTAPEIPKSMEPEINGLSRMVKTVSEEKLGYWQRKILGASHSSGDAILFVDSDVIPAAGWLSNFAGLNEQDLATMRAEGAI